MVQCPKCKVSFEKYQSLGGHLSGRCGAGGRRPGHSAPDDSRAWGRGLASDLRKGARSLRRLASEYDSLASMLKVGSR